MNGADWLNSQTLKHKQECVNKLQLRCLSCNSTYLVLTVDNHIRCGNCKRVFDITLSEIKSCK